MADAKIITFGELFSATTDVIPDNKAAAVEIEGLDGKDYITINTTDDGEALILGGGASIDVGIGITDPSANLHVTKGSGSPTNLAEVDTQSIIKIQARTDNLDTLHFCNNSAMILQGSDGAGNSTTPKNISLQPFGGDVGIGTTEPGYPLAVHDDLPDAGVLGEFRTTGSQNATIAIRADEVDQDSRLWFQSDTATKWTAGLDASDAFNFKITKDHDLGAATKDRFVIDHGTGVVTFPGGSVVSSAADNTAEFRVQNSEYIRSSGMGLSGDDDILKLFADDDAQGSGSAIEFHVDGEELMSIVGNSGTPGAGKVLIPNNPLGIGTSVGTDVLTLADAGGVQAVTQLLDLRNESSGASMINTRANISFRQQAHGGSSEGSGRIQVGTETNWTDTQSTQDSFMGFSISDEGTLTEVARFNAAGNLGIGTESPGETEGGQGTLINMVGADDETGIIYGYPRAGAGIILRNKPYRAGRLNDDAIATTVTLETTVDISKFSNGYEVTFASGSDGTGTPVTTTISSVNVGAGTFDVASTAGIAPEDYCFTRVPGNFTHIQNLNGDGWGNAGIAFINAAHGDSSTLKGEIAFQTRTALGTFDECVRFDHQGYVGIGDTTPSEMLDVKNGAGNILCNDIYTHDGGVHSSDERMKESINPSALGLDFINALTPVSYKWRDTERVIPATVDIDNKGVETTIEEKIEKTEHTRTHYGLIAQDVLSVLDDAGVGAEGFGGYCYTGKRDQHGLRYNEFISPLIKAVQELSAQVKALKEGN